MTSKSLHNPLNILDNTDKYPEIKDVIKLEDNFLKTKDHYNIVHASYLDEQQKKSPSNQKLKSLLDDLTIANGDLIYYVSEIDKIKKDKMSKFNSAIDSKNNLLISDINKTIEELNRETVLLSKMKQRVSDAEGLNKEHTFEIKNTNYKYLMLLISIIVLVISIILSITVPYKTNLESNLFIILCIVVLYYVYTFIKQYKYDAQHKINNQYGNLKSFLNIG